MKEQKKSSTYQLLKLPVAITLALSSSLSYAVGLGSIQVHSHKGENLNASIGITGLTSAQAKNIKINLANNSEYAKRGVKKTPEQSKLNFRLVPTKSGYRIAVSSSGKIDEGFINFVVTVSGAGEQNIVREYSAFLEKNPNEVLNNAIVEKSTTSAKPEKGKKNKKDKVKNEPKVEPTSDGRTRVWLDGQEVPIANNATTEPVAEKTVTEEKKAGAKDLSPKTDKNGQVVYTVKRGDSLARIANRFKPKSVPLDVAKKAIFNTNRHAFSGSAETSLMAGYKLTIPKDLMAAAKIGEEPQVAANEEDKNIVVAAVELTTPAVNETAETKVETPTPSVAENKEPEKASEPEIKSPNLVLDTVDSVGEEKPEAEKPAEVVKTETPAEPEKVAEPEKPTTPVKNIEIEPTVNKDDSIQAKFTAKGTEIIGKIENFINQFLPADLAKKEIAGFSMWQVVVVGGFLALLILLMLIKAILGKKKIDNEDEVLELSRAAQEYEREQEKLNKPEPTKEKIKALNKEEKTADSLNDADLATQEKASEQTDFKADSFDEDTKTQGFEEVSLKEEEDFLEVKEEQENSELSDFDLEIVEQKEFKEENLSAGIIAAGSDLEVSKEEIIDFNSDLESLTPPQATEDFFDELTKEPQIKEDNLSEVEIEELSADKEVEIEQFSPSEIKTAQEQEVSLDEFLEVSLDDKKIDLDTLQTEPSGEEVKEIKEELSEELDEPVAEIPAEEIQAENNKAKLVNPDFSIDLPAPKIKTEAQDTSVPSIEEVMAEIEEVNNKISATAPKNSDALTNFPANSDEALTLGAEDLSNSAGNFVPNNVKDKDLFNTSNEPFNSAGFSAPEKTALGEEDNKNISPEEPIVHELAEVDSFDIDLNGNDLVSGNQPSIEENFSDIQVSAPVVSNSAPFSQADIGSMDINIDLATAYIDSGIKLEKAQIWLEEVLQKGTDIQKQRARDLIEKLKSKL